ncbi:MAG TPA: family 16 glycoside hydrolase [Phycisphaerae bacterium]|nr:family 16 glycoside hydrolase [Phycisphaerae bacterium]
MRRTWMVLTALALAAAVLVAGLDAAQKKPDKPLDPAKVAKVMEALPAKATARPAAPRKIIIFTMTKGFRHGSIPLAAGTFKAMGEKTGAWSSVITDDVNMLAADKLAPFDAVIWDQCTGNITEDEALKKSLVDFVKNGKGLVGNHAATDVGGWKFPEFHEMIGGVFAGHPFRKISVKLDDPAHPLNAAFGGKGFEISDEIYTFKTPYSREKLRVLLSIDWENANIAKKGNRDDNDYALSWCRSYGKGRVFYCAFGHDDAIHWNAPILQHYLDGIQFALGDLKADTTPSAQLKIEPARGPVLGEQKAEGPAPVRVKVYAAPAAPAKPVTLFDGKDLSNWTNAGGGAPGAGWVVQDGAMVRQGKAGDIWTKQRFGDFTLDVEFKTEGNSGIFIRTDNPKDCVQTGIEIQVDLGRGREQVGKNGVGSVYDCLAPSTNPVKDGEWNHAVITCAKNKIAIVMNNVQVIDMDLDKWTEPNKNPDGSKNKFRTALKDFKREGHIGLQDHGAKVSYRNIKVTPLGAAKK